MAFKNTDWELSSKVVTQSNKVEFGKRYVFIENATYDSERAEYKLFVKDLVNDARFSLTYWLTSLDKNNQVVDNTSTIGTLNTLGMALAGVNIGVPNPQDIIGGVVLADVKESRPNAEGKTYARVYTFSAVPGDIAALADIDQYYEGATE